MSLRRLKLRGTVALDRIRDRWDDMTPGKTGIEADPARTTRRKCKTVEPIPMSSFPDHVANLIPERHRGIERNDSTVSLDAARPADIDSVSDLVISREAREATSSRNFKPLIGIFAGFNGAKDAFDDLKLFDKCGKRRQPDRDEKTAEQKRLDGQANLRHSRILLLETATTKQHIPLPGEEQREESRRYPNEISGRACTQKGSCISKGWLTASMGEELMAEGEKYDKIVASLAEHGWLGPQRSPLCTEYTPESMFAEELHEEMEQLRIERAAKRRRGGCPIFTPTFDTIVEEEGEDNPDGEEEEQMDGEDSDSSDDSFDYSNSDDDFNSSSDGDPEDGEPEDDPESDPFSDEVVMEYLLPTRTLRGCVAAFEACKANVDLEPWPEVFSIPHVQALRIRIADIFLENI